ncbi:MAG TPA: hypothetical protein VFA07_00560 [Chthonomonadaceae bacterium]|nr:hypothetical protein [Chthonomonadaceae bacterium]
MTLVGTFSGGGGNVCPETRRGRVLFLQAERPGLWRMRACDINRMTMIGDMLLPGVNGNITRFVSFGRDCYTFRTTEHQIVLITPASGAAGKMAGH